MPPKEQKALYLDAKHGNFVVAPNSIPKPGPDELLVKVKACGLNPIDWKIQKYGLFVEEYPVVLGVGIAGDVVEVGEGVDGFTEGDRVRVRKVAHGVFSNTGGAFQQYALAVAANTSKLPPNVSYDQGATLPSCLGAAYLGLYNHNPHGLGFTSPFESDDRSKYSGTSVLIFGGATTVGQYAIQLAKISGFSPIITTASLKHEQYLKSIGADKVIDRNASFSSLQTGVAAVTSTPIKYILDTVSIPQTQQMANDILAPGGYLQLVQAPEVSFSEDKNVGFTKGARFFPENQKPFATLYGKLEEFLEKELIKPCAVEVVPEGLRGIASGLERLAKDQVSGVKLVAHPEET
ncbi:GroES-like protein [Macrolepiota fuliginosa MF-IS2]|uniref:GroES-like protein n=1 Tax=Macrolepiota fuliginosa MF-IS2 TaxID=1400762 RepID=A0A9P5XIZ8_9AGAR|nr:GroES-like protein [Macrolepiota fuliginosa MF-IS2]